MNTKMKKIFLAIIPLAGLLFMTPAAFAKKHHHHHCWDYDRPYYDRPYYDGGWYERGRNYNDDYYRPAPRYQPRYYDDYYGRSSYYPSSPLGFPWWEILFPRY